MKLSRNSCACLVASLVLVVVGCSGGGAPTQAPPITGKVPDWKSMTKEQKMEVINKQPMPEEARKDALNRIQQGID